MKEVLITEVNSALLTFSNHDNDNGFLEDTIDKVEKKLIERGYEPVGICKNVPFPCVSTSMSLGFVYRYDGEVRWCHIPEVYWEMLLCQCYSRKEVNSIVESILG